MVMYDIELQTGSRSYSGTDAKVYVIIYGEKGKTGKVETAPPLLMMKKHLSK